MYYLASQILFYLIIAALWGFFIGWLIFKLYYKRKLIKVENIWKINVLSLEQQLVDMRTLEAKPAISTATRKKNTVHKVSSTENEQSS